ncbi:hypothetical protein LSH36_1735g00062 [Paralvinella palmiformis]|uniref:Fibronectin type-III domain-containing protein n=1 Tax=Paralvinella palmiformis TaxID=53620 RepID=A0AAD9ISE0_9ANNE|nr:hypothetical protein LSH36_1735g00062 [Paralvinella palmiformis]
MTISICLTANPFTQLTDSNWRFKSSESDYMINGLPNGVLTSVKDTNHPFKKYVMLMITKILESHYGTYTLQVKNKFNVQQLTHVISLLPEGPPVTPRDIKIIYITAVSIYLEWTAGFDGGPDQTFWLNVFDRETSDWFIVNNIPDTTKGQGGLFEYKLTTKQGLLPGHKYIIHVGAINSISNVTGSSVMAQIKRLLDKGLPVITIIGSTFGVLVTAGIVTIITLLWRRGRICKGICGRYCYYMSFNH